MKKFEYKIETLAGEHRYVANAINERGSTGWELVSVNLSDLRTALGFPMHNYIFKRELD